MKYKPKVKDIFLLFAILFLLLTIISIGATYARYITSLSAGGTVELGKWLIKVNNQNILNNSDISEVVEPVFNVGSTLIASDVIAPTSVGTVTLTLDYSGVNVPFEYALTYSNENLGVSAGTADDISLDDFKLISYSVDGGTSIDVSDPTASIKGAVSPESTPRTRTLDLKFSWIDDDDNVLNDINDTTYSRFHEYLGMRFNLEFTQLNAISPAYLYAMTETEKQDIYGSYVTNYTPTNGINAEGTKWRIFHSDGSNIYLIADNYIKYTYTPKVLSNISVNQGVTDYQFEFSDIVDSGFYNGTDDIANNLKTKLLSQYTYTSTNPNAKVTAYLLDTDKWSGFKDNTGFASYAIGSPTLELFRDSYNSTHEQDIETQAVDGYASGYQLRFKTADNSNSFSDELDISNYLGDLYLSDNTNTKAAGMWIASPCYGDVEILSSLSYFGSLSYNFYHMGDYGTRPIICLSSDVKVEKQEDGTYLLVK